MTWDCVNAHWCNAAHFRFICRHILLPINPSPSPNIITPPPLLLVDTQLEERALNKALGTHMLPFQRRFHNQRAQLQRLTVTRLHQRGLPGTLSQIPLGPAPRTSAISRARPKWTRLSSSNTHDSQCPWILICWHSNKSHSAVEQRT